MPKKVRGFLHPIKNLDVLTELVLVPLTWAAVTVLETVVLCTLVFLPNFTNAVIHRRKKFVAEASTNPLVQLTTVCLTLKLPNQILQVQHHLLHQLPHLGHQPQLLEDPPLIVNASHQETY
jgi:hypothetical protein